MCLRLAAEIRYIKFSSRVEKGLVIMASVMILEDYVGKFS